MMDIKFDLKGVDEVIAKLEEQFSERKVSTIVNKTINNAAEVFGEGLKGAQQPYADTGLQIAATTVKKSRKIDGVWKARVGWTKGAGHGPLTHLNEFGYTRYGKTYSPAGVGLIRSYIDSAEGEYISNVRAGLMELMP